MEGMYNYFRYCCHDWPIVQKVLDIIYFANQFMLECHRRLVVVRNKTLCHLRFAVSIRFVLVFLFC